MKNTILISIVFILFTTHLQAQGDVSKARSISSAVVIDGNVRDWVQPLNFYDDASGLMFAIGNNNEDLFLCFTDKDEMKMKKMMSAGWSMEITAKEKKTKIKASLKFPGINVMGIRRGESVYEKKALTNNVLDIYLIQLKTIEAKGFSSQKNELTLNDKEGINIAVGSDSLRHIAYEIAIPLSELGISDLKNPDEVFTLHVTVNGLERPSSGGGFGGERGGMGRGRSESGMGGMGGMGGGRGGGGRGGRSSGMYHQGESGGGGGASEKVTFKQKFTLAVN